MSDPFAEPEFQDRLRKLLRMLASDQDQEADTARRKLLQHLAQHDLSANDLADRLSGAPSEELAAARTAMRHAEQRAARAEERRAQAEFALGAGRGGEGVGGRSRRRSSRGTRVGLGVLALAVPCAGLALFLLLNRHAEPPARRVASAPASTAPAAPAAPRPPPSQPSAEGTAMFSTGGIVREVRQPAEWVGTVAGAGAELRSDMRPDALVLAVLQDGERVTVQRAVTYQGAEWLQVSTASGPGFVPVARVRRRE